MRLTTDVIIAFIITSCASSTCAGVGERSIRFPVDSSDSSAIGSDSTKTTTPPPTFRIDNPPAEEHGPDDRPAVKVQKPRAFGPSRTITCLSLAACFGRRSSVGPAIVLSHNYNRHVAGGLGASLEIGSGSSRMSTLCAQLRVYPNPDVVQYYLLTDVGIDVNMKGTGGGEDSAGPMLRLGLGILSKSGGPLDVFIEGGYRTGTLANGPAPYDRDDALGSGYVRAGLAF